MAGGENVVPSALALNGTTLYMIHATDPADARVGDIATAAVSLVGADLVLADFGVLLPEIPRSIADGDPFLRFRVLIDGVHEADGTSFSQVRAEQIVRSTIPAMPLHRQAPAAPPGSAPPSP